MSNKFRIIDLFSGIGGFSLAASWVWGDDLDIVCFCEKDEFCRKVLKKHWPETPYVEDVNELDRIVAYASEFRRNRLSEREQGRTQEKGGLLKSERGIDLLCGGFPCQPASCAGQRKGTSDDRWLWPALLAAIQAIKPRYLLLENVPGLLSLESGVVFERCLLDLEAQGYEVQPMLVPACGVNASHRRERLWIVANSNRGVRDWRKHQQERETEGRAIACGADCHAADTERFNDDPGGYGASAICREWREQAEISGSYASDTQCRARLPGHQNEAECVGWDSRQEYCGGAVNTANSNIQRSQVGEVQSGNGRTQCKATERNPWDEHWYEAATRLCRVDARVSNRVERLRALGNSIVPQVAAQIMRAIKATDE